MTYNMPSADTPSAKRQKLDFRPGNIKQVTLENFTTYSHAQFKLSPSLNMIIGPNGTGKSTLVAAICLGLGGKLDLIQRKSLKSMIKTGTTTSMIETILQDHDDEELIIKRTFTALASHYEINGKKSTEHQVIERVLSLNIQLNNLCHFLPQERVAEFAGLSPEKLLLETQRTLKAGDLYIKHQDLIRLDEKRDEVTEQLNTNTNKLEILEVEKAKLDEAVAKLNQLNEKTIDLQFHRYLLPYAIYEDERAHKKHLKERLDQTRLQLEEFESQKEPLQNDLDSCKQKVRELKEVEEAQKVNERDLDSQYNAKNRECYKINEDIGKLRTALTETKKSRQTKRQEVSNLLAQIHEHENEMSEMDDSSNDTKAQLSELKVSRTEHQHIIQELADKVTDLKNINQTKTSQNNTLKRQIAQETSRLNVEDKLNILQNMKYSKLAENTYQMHKLLRANRELKNHYFEAPVVTCSLNNRKLAGVVERVVGQNNLMSLTFVSQENYNKIPSDAFHKFNSPIRVVKQQAERPSIPTEDLKRYGFEKYLCDFLQGPSEVLNMLNVNSKLNTIPVTTQELSESQLERLMAPDSNGRIPFMKFVSGQQLFSVLRSKYGNRSFVYSTETLADGKFFKNEGISADIKAEIEATINTMRGTIERNEKEIAVNNDKLIESNGSLKKYQKEIESIQSEMSRLNSQRSRKTQLATYIESKRERIEKLKKDLSRDQTVRVNNIRAKIFENSQKYADVFSEASKFYEEFMTSKQVSTQLQYDIIQESNKKQSIQLLLEQLDDYKHDLVKAYEKAKAEYASVSQTDARKQISEVKNSLNEAEYLKLGDLAHEYKQNQQLTERIVREKIKLIEDEINVSTADRSSITKLKQIEAKLEEVNNLLPTLRRDKDSYDTRIAKIEKEWEPRLSKLISKLSKAFKKRFVAVASNGEVQLSKATKYKDWRLEILVKFRDESELKILDRQSQSGGERAVSTIFFIMALQKLTEAPFRIVDEINQGMDPNNEKNAHKYLVHTACSSTTSQYFLVTPKLLTGLYYHPQMKVHCIYTGPLIDDGGKDFMDFSK